MSEIDTKILNRQQYFINTFVKPKFNRRIYVRIYRIYYQNHSSDSMLVMGASLVAFLTPTPVDDGLVKKLL